MQVVYKSVVLNFRLRILRAKCGMLGIEMNDPEEFQLGNKSTTPSLKVIDEELSPVNHGIWEVVNLQHWQLLRGGRYNCLPANNLGPRSFSTTSQIIDNSGLIDILSQDDVDKFREYFSNEAGLSSYNYPALLHLCLERKAKNCALYLLKGGLPHSLPSVHEEIVRSEVELLPLFSAIRNMRDPEVVTHLCMAKKVMQHGYHFTSTRSLFCIL